MSNKIRDRSSAERLTKSTSAYLKDVYKANIKPKKEYGTTINWNERFVAQTIEQLESEDEKSQ